MTYGICLTLYELGLDPLEATHRVILSDLQKNEIARQEVGLPARACLFR